MDIIETVVWFGNRRGEWSESGYRCDIPMLKINANDSFEDFIDLYDCGASFNEKKNLEEKNKTHFALRCIINFILFLEMSNVFPSLKYSNKPKKGHKLTAHLHDSYHVLKLKHHKTGVVSELTCERASRSPRQHWRRGHHRRKKFSQDKIWINAVIVNKGWKGKISKDYEIEKEIEYLH
jgi:hypothetical protein